MEPKVRTVPLPHVPACQGWHGLADSVRSVIKSSIFGFFSVLPGRKFDNASPSARVDHCALSTRTRRQPYRAFCASDTTDPSLLSSFLFVFLFICKHGLPLECFDGAVLQKQLITAEQCACNTRAHHELLISSLRPLLSTRSRLLP